MSTRKFLHWLFLEPESGFWQTMLKYQIVGAVSALGALIWLVLR